MKFLVFFMSLNFFSGAFASKVHKAHAHGEAKLNIAYDSKLKALQIEFEGASEGVLGHEHGLKTEAEKKDFEDLKALWKKGVLSSLESFECALSEDKMELELEGKHSEIMASLKYICAKDLEGQELELMLPKSFNELKLSKKHKLNHLDVTVLPAKSGSYSVKSKSTVKVKL
jgi:hypothetical protein